MRVTRIGAIVAGLALFATTGVARASINISPDSDPVPDQSWIQSFSISYGGLFDTFDSLRVMIVGSNASFEQPGITDFNRNIFFGPGNWHQTSNSGSVVAAAGSDTKLMSFKLHVTDPSHNAMPIEGEVLHIQAFDGSTLVVSKDLEWNSIRLLGRVVGGYWDVESPGTWPEAATVPEPASLVLWSGLCAVGLVVAWRKRGAA
jgi:hypothetical protein